MTNTAQTLQKDLCMSLACPALPGPWDAVAKEVLLGFVSTDVLQVDWHNEELRLTADGNQK